MMKKLIFSISIIITTLGVQGHVSGMEWNVNRPGSDFSNFDLPEANPKLCQEECAVNPKCKAWTYVKPNTTQGPRPRCWLKYAVPPTEPNNCCVSGVKVSAPPQPTSGMEWNVNRPGSDFSNFDLPEANPMICQDECAVNPKCKAWTYVKPYTTQGPRPRCWLKYAIPPTEPNNCCVSGIK